MKIYIFIIALAGFRNYSEAQIIHPVKWSYALKRTTANTAVVLIKANINEGWHIYSIHQKNGGPVKTSFSFVPSEKYALVDNILEPKPRIEHNKAFAMKVLYFENLVVFKQKIRISKSPTVVHGSLNFMACNDQKCLPPEDVTFEITIN